jgi:isochorismate synthase
MLLYRFPGKSIVRKEGSFERRTDFTENGFVICSFDKQNHFQFVENQIKNKEISTKEIVTVSKADYIVQGTKLVNAIRNLGIQKTVLSRIHTQVFDSKNSLALFEQLEKAYPTTFVYYFEDADLGNWLGASPEILFQLHGNSGFTIALAATKKSGDQSAWNQKETMEQAFVTDFIDERLSAIGVDKLEKNGPYEQQAGPVKHLKTDFSFSIGALSTFEILKALHPTPAVSGLPQTISLELINSLEKHQRELYAGYIGLVEENQASVYVNLRCCQLSQGKIHLYLGGGYTKDSDPQYEWEETVNKSKTILDLVQKL